MKRATSMSTAPHAVVSWAALLLWMAAACGGDGDAPAGGGSAADAASVDPFPSSPPDGAVAVSASTAGEYRPTAAGAPSTDIWLGRLVMGDGGLGLEGLENVTHREGYDNQPSFSPDGAAIYYVSAVDATQTEVFRYDLSSGEAEQVTHTAAASEFSPTFIPGQDAFSVTYEAQDLQHLWRYRADGSEMGPIFGTVRPVGYHAWADEAWAVMFVLGDPATLQVANALTGEVRTVVERPGRSLHRIPGTEEVSFVHMRSADEWSIERFHPTGGEPQRITLTLPGRQDYAWTPDGGILMGDGATLHLWREGVGWREVADLSGEGRGDISRIAVSPDGTRVAIVMNREG